MSSITSGFHLPLNPIDEVNQPPLHFLWVQDGCILSTGVLWTAAYVLYIRQAFEHKSYGMPIVALCANIGWELIYGVFYPLSMAETLTFVPWFLIDTVIVYTTVKFGGEQWKQSPLVASNLHILIGVGCILSLLGHAALINTCASREEAGFWAGFSCQILLGTSSVIQLMSRDNPGGHSWTIWLCRWVGSAAAVFMFSWRHWHYPQDYPYVGTPVGIFLLSVSILADLTYPFVFSAVASRQKSKVQ